MRPFWETKPLEAMTTDEWESLCDGCAQCCLHKMQCDDTGDMAYTRIACRLLDCSSGHCRNYTERLRHVPDCTQLTPATAKEYDWLPSTCAYRLIAAGQPLPAWHPLLTGDRQALLASGHSVVGMAISEELVDPADWEDHVVRWVEADSPLG